MCYSAESSILIFSVVNCCILYLYKRNYTYDRTLALIFFCVSLMQLSEFLMLIDLKCGLINNLGSKLAFIILCLEPIIIIFTIYYYNSSKISDKYIKYILYIYLIFFGYFILRTIFLNKKLCSLPGKKYKNLIWDHSIFNRLSENIYNLFWILYYLSGLLFFTFKNRLVGILYFLLIIITLGISKFLNRNSPSWKSIWCIIINIIPLFAIVIGGYFHSEKIR